ncbi:MAG: hypothetical protein EXR47_04530 [Dehalococcoidia bacterium]|nr:hypothetical protein [Dehalococcoidia bacterium]
MAPAKQLYELQQLELEAQQRVQALKTVQVRLQDTGARDRAQGQAAGAKKRADGLRAELRDAELAVQSLVSRVQETEQRLYGGRTTNSKELVSLQDDLKMLTRLRQEGEVKVLTFMGQAESAEAGAASTQLEAVAALKAWEELQGQLRQDEAGLIVEITEYEGQVGSAAAALSGRETALYAALKKARGGVAVGRVERGLCRGCGVALPSGDVQRARAAQELVRCNSCGRVLYVA